MTPPTTPNNAIIIERLEALQCDLTEIKAQLKEMQKTSNDFRVDYEVRHAALDAKATAAHNRIDGHDAELRAMEKAQQDTAKTVAGLAFQAKILGWIGGVFGVSVIALIWGVLTHQVTLMFP